MTFPGGGSANMGTVTGKVRIDYETSNVRVALRDLDDLQGALADMGAGATQGAKEVERAGGVITQFGKVLDRLADHQVPNPVAGMGQRVETETGRATKALAALQHQAERGQRATPNIKVTPKSVELDRRAFDNMLKGQITGAMRITAAIKLSPSAVEFDQLAFRRAVQGTNMQRIVVRAPIHLDPSQVTVNQAAIDNAVRTSGSVSGQGGGDSGGGAAMLPMLGRITAAAGVATAAVGGVSLVLGKGFSRLNQIDEATVKLSAMGKSMQEIQAISQSSLKSVEGTAFGLNEAFNTAADAINAGIKPGEELNKYLSATANTASLAGVGMQELGTAFAQAAIEGKLTGDVFQLLVSRQVPVLKNLSEEYGVTQQKAREMVSNGEIDFNRFIASMSRSEGAAKAMGNTISGSFKNLGASVSRLGANILAPLFGKDAADGAGPIAQAIQVVTKGIDWLGKTVKENASGVITFWEVLGKGGLIAAKAFTTLVSFISDAMVKITEVIGDTAGWLTRAFAAVADFVGADGVAGDANELADSMHNLGAGLRENRDINMGKFNRGLDQGWKSLEEWAEKARKAAGAGQEFSTEAGGAAGAAMTLKDALDALEIKAETAESALMGTNEQFKDFIETVKDKGGTDALIKALTDIRERFENGGRAVKNYADAIDKMKDATASAADKATSLLDALRGLGVLPGGEALSSYNEAFEEMTSYMSDIIDMSDTMGNALAKADGTLDLNSKNARNLLTEITDIRQKMVELIASGEANPDEAYARTVEGLNQLLQGQAGISPDVAQKIIDTYLPKDAILESMKAQNPKEALEGIFANDPAELESQLNLLTTTEDILGQIVGPDGKLHVPTVLDVQTPGGGAGSPTAPTPPAPPSAKPAPLPPGLQLKPGSKPFTGPVDPTNPDYATAPDGSVWKRDDWYDPATRPPAVTAPAAGPVQGPPSGTITPGGLDDLLGVPNLTNSEEERKKFLELANNKEALDKALAENPEIASQLDQLVTQANAQGKNMGVAFAEGLMTGSAEVKEALLQLAGMAGDYLGNSPAKYGPLSGKGWTLHRGKTFTTDWAKGIASEADTAAGAVEGVAGAATGSLSAASGPSMTWDESRTQMLGDLQQFSDLGKSLLDFGAQIADIVFSVGELANDLSGGTLFPNSYIKDPNAKKTGSTLPGWNPQGWTPPTQFAPGQNNTSAGTGGATPGAMTVPLIQNPDGTWTSSDPEWAKLIKRESGGRNIGQQITDANGGPGSPNAAQGLFQITPDTWRSNGGERFAPNPLAATPQQQAEIAASIFGARGGQPWGSGPGNPYGREDENLLRAGLSAAGATPFPAQTTSATTALQSTAQGNVPAPGAMPSGSYGLDPGTAINYGGAGFPDWVYQVADQFGLEASTYAGHQENGQGGHIASGPVAANPGGLNRGIDWRAKAGWDTAEGAAQMEAFAKYLADNGLAEQVIYENAVSGNQIGFPFNSDYSGNYPGHRNHVHTRHSQGVPLPGQGVPAAMLGATGFGSQTQSQGGDPTAQRATTQALTGIWENTNGLPSMPSQVRDLVAGDPLISNAMTNRSALNQDSVVPVLQRLDTMIGQQTNLNTEVGRSNAEALTGYKNQLTSDFGLTQGPNALDTAQSIFGGAAGVVGDTMATVDEVLKAIGHTQEMTKTLSRGLENTGDVSKIVDGIQSYISVFQKGAQAVSSGLGLASSIASIGGADPSGGGAAAAGGLAAASGIASIVAQVAAGINTAIDVTQEITSIAGKYAGRFATSWVGLGGAEDIRWLLDERTGQMQAWTSSNPQDKKTLNTLGRSLGRNDYPGRQAPSNNFTIYQGPGQDPRDTMDDAMFTVRMSGVGAFGYGTRQAG